MSPNKSDDDDQTWEPSERRGKRARANSGKALRVSTGTSNTPDTTHVSLEPLLISPLPEYDDFESILPKEDYLAARARLLKDLSEPDPYNNKIRPLTISELQGLRAWFESTATAGRRNWTSGEAILMRRLKMQKIKKCDSATFSYDALRQNSLPRQALTPLPPPSSSASMNEESLTALYSIRKTPYMSSFASRLLGGGSQCEEHTHLIHRDWETQAQWMDLLSDIRLHYLLSHPGNEKPDEVVAPIDYISLQRTHLPQIHDMLARVFWPGIDVSGSLQYSPTQCTIVATYKRLVVGAAFLSSPEETYLTYIVVRPGWENANIASVMLYHLITANPKKDITLHVSANNPAMLLYNKFGFKAEEFIVGFYEDYLSKDSKACKNAFRLRLRR